MYSTAMMQVVPACPKNGILLRMCVKRDMVTVGVIDQGPAW